MVENKKRDPERDTKELLFQKRLADLRSKKQRFAWESGELAQFEIPRDESKLLADREVEDPSLSDEELELRALLDLTSRTCDFKTFYRRLNYEIRRARRYSRPLSLILVAVDQYEVLSLKVGPAAKDAAVQAAARLLLACIRDVDIAGRCREDTFGIILPETAGPGAEIAAERIRTRMEAHRLPQPFDNLAITCSVAVAHFPNHGKEVEELFGNAVDALLWLIKRGGNSVMFAQELPD
ncbi:MAG: diguanylate cyclase [Candidatus Obscuribacterales bacterium]|nr:diguanylate cyclase [Candidatus Obscuribacterales bacterium]